MKAEKDCSTNQIEPQQLIVNGQELSEEELSELLGCEVPPNKLKPGKYWYDKHSGFWGKEGKKPECMITPKLNVGGVIRADASNGNTRLFINGREITRIEFWVLKITKVMCYRDMHLWVHEDGSCKDSDKKIKENIWGKLQVWAIPDCFDKGRVALSSSRPSSYNMGTSLLLRMC